MSILRRSQLERHTFQLRDNPQICVLAVVETTLHLPVSKIKLTPRSTAETRSVSTPPVRKRPAEFAMSATKHPSHETTDFSSQRLHDLCLSTLQNYRSNGNAQTTSELGHAGATALGLVTLY
jgi:hypothetical protein